MAVTNWIKAGEWYNERHINMTAKYGIDAFKFDAGEVVWFPDDFNFDAKVTNPCMVTHEYVKLVSVPSYRDRIEVRAVYQNQNEPILVRMMDKDSHWGHDNGLRTMIPTALLFSTLGYPFILPGLSLCDYVISI